MQKFLEKNYVIIIAIVLGFVTLVSLLNAKNDSLIYDEAAHIPAGYSYFQEQDLRLNPEHPPLLKDLAVLPLLFINPKLDTTQDFWTKDNADAGQWNAGKSFLFGGDNNPDQIIFWSRLPIILLSLLLGLFIFKWTREIAGITAGLFALILYAFDPNILGHNHFVTTDLGIAAFIVFAFYYFLKFIKNPTWKNVAIAGLFLGLVQLAKFSSVLTFPVFGLILIIYPLVKLHGDDKKHHRLKTLGEYLLKGFAAFVLSLIVVYVAYAVSFHKTPQTKLPEIINHYFHDYDTRPINVYARQALFWMNEQPVLVPLAEYFFGVARVFQRVAGGNVAYLMGEVNTKGFFNYFPIIFLIKEPIATLSLILFALGIGLANIIRSLKSSSENFFSRTAHSLAHYLRTRIVEFSMLVFILLYAVTSISGKLNIGFRHLFPILPFMYILITKTIFDFLRTRHNQTKVIINIALGGFLLFLISGTILAYPYYTSYFNQLAGGPKEGYHIATDSNADWGQDLKRLKIFLTEHPEITKLKVDYFGMANLDYYIGGRYEKWWGAKRPIEEGWYAISVLFLQESTYNQAVPDNQSYRWLKNKKPDFQVGTSILIYNISSEEAEKINTSNLQK
jgi:hypothetical protein